MITKKNNKWNCINCNESGHTFKYCTKPIISYGIILYKKINNFNMNYLIIERRDSIGYTDIIRGKYYNKETLLEFIYSMTENEIEKIKKFTFKELWDDIFINKYSRIYNSEYQEALYKFNKYRIQDICSMITDTKYINAEIGFPKGRKHLNESPLRCAKREFFEETGINDSWYKIRSDIIPFKEEYLATNGKRYIHIYFLAEIDKNIIINLEIDKNNYLQSGEVKAIKWMTFKDAYKNIRKYHYIKRGIIYKINNFLLKTNFIDKTIIHEI